MAGKKRQCGTCRFFIQSDTPGFGTCTNPAWPESSAPLLLLRPNELACRTRWGTNLWQDPSDTSEPGIAAAPQQPSLPEPPSVQLQYDDEVTSVSIAGSTRAPSSFEDDVVDTSTVIPDSFSWNDELQSERRELLRQSPHDAVAGARKRHMDKQTRQRELVPFAEDDQATGGRYTPEASTPAPSTTSRSVKEPVFPADDFVEDERGTAVNEDVYDDELVDEGLAGGKRSPRLKHLLRNDMPPKNAKAMTLGAASEMAVTAHNPEDREQWNTVPTIQPGFDLPLMGSELTPAEPVNVRLTASAASAMPSPPVNRTMSVAREFVTEDRKQTERAQRRVEVPLADDIATQAVNVREKLTHAPSNQAALIERWKTSPLRGTSSAPKSMAPTPEQMKPRRPQVLQETERQEQVRLQETTSQRHQAPRPISPVRPAVEQHRSQQEATRRPTIPLHLDTSPYQSQDIEIAPSVPRCCGTCASYRASDIEGRGSCTNKYAGPVQRMVSETDLSCQHTFGCLWIPADEEIWLTELPDHSGPTPRVDAMIKRRERRKLAVLPDIADLTS